MEFKKFLELQEATQQGFYTVAVVFFGPDPSWRHDDEETEIGNEPQFGQAPEKHIKEYKVKSLPRAIQVMNKFLEDSNNIERIDVIVSKYREFASYKDVNAGRAYIVVGWNYQWDEAEWFDPEWKNRFGHLIKVPQQGKTSFWAQRPLRNMAKGNSPTNIRKNDLPTILLPKQAVGTA